MNKNLKINLVMQNMEVYLRAKQVFLNSQLELQQYANFLRPEMDRISHSMKRLEDDAR